MKHGQLSSFVRCDDSAQRIASAEHNKQRAGKRKESPVCFACFAAIFFFFSCSRSRTPSFSLEDYTHHRGITSGCCCGSFVRISPLPPFTSPFFFFFFLSCYLFDLSSSRYGGARFNFFYIFHRRRCLFGPRSQGSKQISEYLGDILCLFLFNHVDRVTCIIPWLKSHSLCRRLWRPLGGKRSFFFFFWKMLGKRDKRQIVCYQSAEIFNIFRSSWADYTADDTFMRTLEETRNFRTRGGRDFCVEFCRCIKMRHLAPWIACYFHGFVTDWSIHAQAISAYWLSYVNAHNKRLHILSPLSYVIRIITVWTVFGNDGVNETPSASLVCWQRWMQEADTKKMGCWRYRVAAALVIIISQTASRNWN